MKPGFGLIAKRVFDETFEPISYYADEHSRMGSIEIAIRHEGKTYVLSIEALPTHMQRTAIDMDEEAEQSSNEHDQVYVVTSDEILPSDLLEIKKKSFEELEPFLVEQEK